MVIAVPSDAPGNDRNDSRGIFAMSARVAFTPWAEALDHTCTVVWLHDAGQSLPRPVLAFSCLPSSAAGWCTNHIRTDTSIDERTKKCLAVLQQKLALKPRNTAVPQCCARMVTRLAPAATVCSTTSSPSRPARSSPEISSAATQNALLGAPASWTPQTAPAAAVGTPPSHDSAAAASAQPAGTPPWAQRPTPMADGRWKRAGAAAPTRHWCHSGLMPSAAPQLADSRGRTARPRVRPQRRTAAWPSWACASVR